MSLKIPVDLSADHPFFYALVDRQTVLFNGQLLQF